MILSRPSPFFWFCSRCYCVVMSCSDCDSRPVCLKCGSSLFVEVEC
jgi:hypothetical protein